MELFPLTDTSDEECVSSLTKSQDKSDSLTLGNIHDLSADDKNMNADISMDIKNSVKQNVSDTKINGNSDTSANSVHSTTGMDSSSISSGSETNSLADVPEQKLSKMFDDGWKQLRMIYNKCFVSSFVEIETEVISCLIQFDMLRVLIDNTKILKNYKNVSDIPTSRLKYILVSAVLGQLVRRLQFMSRAAIISACKDSLRQFITDCKVLGMTDVEIPLHKSEGGTCVSQDCLSYINLTDDERWSKDEKEEEYINAFVKLQTLIESRNTNENEKREYFIALINYYIIHSVNLLDFVRIEECESCSTSGFGFSLIQSFETYESCCAEVIRLKLQNCQKL